MIININRRKYSPITITKASKNQGEAFHFLILSVFLFFYIYSVSFPGLPRSFLSRRFSAVAFFLYSFFRYSFKLELNDTPASKEYGTIIKLHLALLVFGLINMLIVGPGTGRNIISSYLEVILFGSMAFYGISHSYRSTKQFLKSILIVSVFQSILVLIGTLYSPFLDFLINFTDSSIWDLAHMARYGYAIGFGCLTSSGVFKLSLGLVALVYFICEDHNHLFWYFLLYVLISVVMIAVARTGLVIVTVPLFFILIVHFRRKPTKAIKIIFLFLVLFVLGYFIITATSLLFYFQFIFKRLINTVNNNLWGSFFELYFGSDTTIIPHIGLVGELIVSGTSAFGNQINADGGYIKVFFAMGIPLAIVFYSLVTYLTLSMKHRSYSFESHVIIIMLFIILLLGEFKEFFIEDVYFLVIIMVFKHLLDNEVLTSQKIKTKKDY